MVAGDECDQLDLVVGEPGEVLGVPDHVVAVLVVPRVRDGDPNVREERARLEQLALDLVETVQIDGLVEQLEAQMSHVSRVLGVVVHELDQVQHALSTQVVQVMAGRAVEPGREVEQHALPQCIFADHDLVDGELGDDLLEDQGAGDDDVRTPSFDACDRLPLSSGRRIEQGLDDGSDVVTGDHEVVEGPGLDAVRGRGDGGQAFDGPRAADRRLESEAAYLGGERQERRADVSTALVDGIGIERLSIEEASGEPNGAEAQAPTRQHLGSRGHHEFGRAAADVAQQGLRVPERNRVADTDVDEPGLLEPRHDLDVEPGLGPRPVDEVEPVLGFTHRARGNGGDACATRGRDLTHAGERRHASVDRIGLETLHVTTARAESDHLLLLADHIEPTLPVDPCHDHVDRVRADVDGGEDVIGHPPSIVHHRDIT